MIKPETQFKHTLSELLWKKGHMVQAIETRVRAGVPDLYVAGHCDPVIYDVPYFFTWIELKKINKPFPIDNKKSVKIPFRPGQQEWAMDHYSKTGKPVVLLVCFTDGWYGLRLTQLYQDKYIPVSKFQCVALPGQEWYPKLLDLIA